MEIFLFHQNKTITVNELVEFLENLTPETEKEIIAIDEIARPAYAWRVRFESNYYLNLEETIRRYFDGKE